MTEFALSGDTHTIRERDTGKHAAALTAIAESNHPVIAWIIAETVLVHDIHTRCGHAGTHAEEGL